MKRPVELIYSLNTRENFKKTKYATDNLNVENHIKKMNSPQIKYQ